MNMLKNPRFSFVSVIVVALAALLATTVQAQQLGLVAISETPTSGGELRYHFDVDLASPGTLVAKATVKAKRWKTTFPEMITTEDAGVTEDIVGPAIQIPANFTGKAVLRVKVTFNGKRIGSRTIRFTVQAAPSPTALTVSTNLYDVGFENAVTLNGSIVPTTDLSGTLTYSWTQTIGKPVALSATNAAAPSFRTDDLTNFVTLGTAMYFTDVDEDGNSNQVYVTREDRFATNNVNSIALDAERVAASTYGFRLLVSNGSVTRTGLFTVACSIQTPAQPSIPVGVTAFYRGATNSTDWTLLAKPAGSAATLNHPNGLIPELRPDVEGIYVIQDNVTGNFVTNTAATWIGVQFCAICHGPNSNVGKADMVTPWSQTGHASMAQRGVDGVLSSYYSEACFQCHTVGYNKSPAAVNAGFDDVAKDLGWKFPSVLHAGNYAAMPDELKNKANIQCESCHGPGSRHPGFPSVTTDVRVCGQCHQDGDRHFRPQQWEISPHAGGYENISNSRGTNPQCARCHSPVGYLAVAKGTANVGTTNSVPTAAGALTCQACHNPHDKYDNPDRHQLRVYDTALLGNPYFRSNDVTVALGEAITSADPRLTNGNLVVTNLGNAATCITCHNGRQLPTQTVLYGTNTVLSAGTRRPTTIGTSKYYQIGGPHDQTASEAFLGVGMYDYGQVIGNSFHTYLADCTTCHMYQLRAPANGVAQDQIAINDVVTNVTTALYNQYANLLGNHTFKMDYVSVNAGVTNTVDNIAACNQCHGSFEPVDSFDFKPANARDYDGNGLVEGIQTETHGLLNNLGFLLKTTGVTITTNAAGNITSVSTSAGYSTNNVELVEAQSKAAWNWLACYREGSFGVHNTQYATRLLQTSYTDLSTNFYGDATRTYQEAFPNAYLR
jgi:hypothetical protein